MRDYLKPVDFSKGGEKPLGMKGVFVTPSAKEKTSQKT
jgi:hypothetical protein